MHSLLEKQEALHNAASALLETYILPIATKYGTCEVGGSYLYGLLNFPDVDVDIVNPDLTKELHTELCAEFIALDVVSEFETVDRVHYPHGNPGIRPRGYWLCPTIRHGEYRFTVDIWFQAQKNPVSNSSSYTQRL